MTDMAEGGTGDSGTEALDGVDWVYVLGDVTGVGGTERRMSEAAASLVAAGGRVTAFVSSVHTASPLTTLLSESGIGVRNTRSILELARFLRRRSTATVFTFGIRPSLVLRGLRAARVIENASFSLRNGLDQGWSTRAHRLDRFTSRWQDGYLVNSPAVRDHLLAKGARPGSVFVAEGALGAEWLDPSSARGDGRPVVAMVGNSRPEKNQLFGLEVFERVATGENLLKVFTDDASALAARVSPSLAPFVQFVEGVRLGPDDYDSVDVLLMPSTSESVPRVLLEARARGCSVVTSDAGSSATVVDERSSRVISGFEVDVWAEALAGALDEVDRSRRQLWSGARTTRQYVVDVARLTSLPHDRRRSQT